MFMCGRAGWLAGEETAVAKPDLGLVQVAGHILFDYLKDYKFYIKLLTGYKLDEELTVWMLSIVCNMTYCILVFLGLSLIKLNSPKLKLKSIHVLRVQHDLHACLPWSLSN
jgi:hypothetical protein